MKALYCPKDLNPRAKELWKELCPMLSRKGLLTDEDEHLMKQLCLTIAELEFAEQMILDKGYVMEITTKTGQPYAQVSPYFSIRDKALERFLKLSDRFGMSPAARKKMSIEALLKQPKDSLESLLG